MGRIFLLIIIFIIAGLFTIVKSVIGIVTDNESLKKTTLKGETKKVMNKTARGVQWMEEQWEQSKTDAKNTDRSLFDD